MVRCARAVKMGSTRLLSEAKAAEFAPVNGLQVNCAGTMGSVCKTPATEGVGDGADQGVSQGTGWVASAAQRSRPSDLGMGRPKEIRNDKGQLVLTGAMQVGTEARCRWQHHLQRYGQSQALKPSTANVDQLAWKWLQRLGAEFSRLIETDSAIFYAVSATETNYVLPTTSCQRLGAW